MRYFLSLTLFRLHKIWLYLGLIMLSACADKRPHVVLETDLGNIEVELYLDKAPISGADFLYYIDNKLYDDQGFYRTVRPDNDPLNMGMSLIQGGRIDASPLTSGIIHEGTDLTGLSNITGAIAIARDEPGSGSAAYFFINLDDNNFLDTGGTRNPDKAGYAVFGQVISGLEIAQQIQAGQTQEPADVDSPQTPINGIIRSQILAEPVIINRGFRK